jgi:DNA-binding response OmpR family regulator
MGEDRVLLVEDDETVSDVVRRYLERDGMAVDVLADGAAALARATADPPDIVVLDLMLPGLSGLEVCRRLRSVSAVPIVMLTALGEEADRVLGLETGADDYVTKPFSPRELTLRVRSVLRRGREPAHPPTRSALLADGDLSVDVGARIAAVRGTELPLTVREFDLLAFLLAHPRHAFTRAELLEHVWGWTFGDQATVTVHVRRLREKLLASGTDPRVATVWGVGYRYDPVPA